MSKKTSYIKETGSTSLMNITGGKKSLHKLIKLNQENTKSKLQHNRDIDHLLVCELQIFF